MSGNEAIEDLIDQLIGVGAEAVRLGLVLAAGGNLSARTPGSNTFAVTGTGTLLSSLKHSEFSIMDLDGNVVSGCPEPSSEWKLHQRTYLRRPDVNAVIHLHPRYAVLLDAMGYEIRMFTLDHAAYVTSVGHTEYYPNGSDELADSAAEQELLHDCVILGNHGCSAVGDTIKLAFTRALNLEHAAEDTYNALLLGDTTTQFPPEELKRFQDRRPTHV